MRLLSTLVLCALFAACGKKDAPPTPPTAAPPAAADTSAPSEAADTAEPAPEADTAQAPAAEADTAQAAADAGEDWLVWSRAGDGWVTRWVSVTGDAFAVVAEKKAVIVSDGSHLFRVERADREASVLPCECLEEEEADCKAVGKVTRPGLRAVDLAGGDPIGVYVPEGDGMMYGGDMDLGVDLAGGSGALLFVNWTEGGYFCGAHGTWEGGQRIFDLSRRDARSDVFEAVDRELPAAVRDPARDAIYEPLKECDDEDLTKEAAAERMSLDGVAVSVGEGGAPRVQWSFSADVAYACSADYGVHGDSTSALLPAGAALGLAGPLPQGLLAAFAAAPEKGTIGWARVSLEGDARDAALASFRSSGEPAWGPTHFSEKMNEAAAPTGDAAAAKKAVSEGRKLTREKRYSDAITKFTEAIALDAGHAAAYSGRGYAALLADDFEAARADLEKALTLDDEPKYQAQVYYNLGQIAEKQKDLAAAKTAYQKSLELRPNDTVKKALERVGE
ncbi:MAG: tetratricopeptide repeat protein [Deltaproteobacteria bacterium]|nr:MAG: tetratricopeptide repeat protein [Deltaproteobacteria bacterium]